MSSILVASYDRFPAPKGAARHILANVHALAADHELSLVTLAGEPSPDAALPAGVRHRGLALSEPNWLLRGLEFGRWVAELARRHPHDFALVRSPFEGLAIPAETAIVYEVNALYSVEASVHHPAVLGLPSIRDKLRALELELFARARAFVTPAETTRTHLADLGVDPRRIFVVPNSPAVPLGEPRRGSGPPRAIYVGGLAPWQGLEAFLPVFAEAPGLTLTIVTGDGSARKQALGELIDRLGLGARVQVLPPLPAPALGELLSAHDLGVAPLIPSERNLIQGAAPIKILDYLARGLPVLAPDMPCVRELVGPDYPLYPRWSRGGLSAALAELSHDPERRRRLGAEGRARVEATYSSALQRDRLLAVYAKLTREAAA